MVKADNAAMNNNANGTNREYFSGLVEVSDNIVKYKINSEFLTRSVAGFTGLIPLDAGDDVASINKMTAAAEYFAALAQDLRKAAKFYQSLKPGSDAPVAVEVKPGNQRQQSAHLEQIHALLEQLPAEEKAIYQSFGFGERARMYKMIDYDPDPVKMQAILCSMIKDISAKKGA